MPVSDIDEADIDRPPFGTFGVGHSPRACFVRLLPVAGRPAFDPLLLVASGVALGVSHDEDAGAAVRGAHVGCANNRPLRIEPDAGQRSENSGHPPNKEAEDVLHDDVARSNHASGTSDAPPEAGSLS